MLSEAHLCCQGGICIVQGQMSGYVYAHVCICTSVCAHVYICMYVCMHVCVWCAHVRGHACKCAICSCLPQLCGFDVLFSYMMCIVLPFMC